MVSVDCPSVSVKHIKPIHAVCILIHVVFATKDTNKPQSTLEIQPKSANQSIALFVVPQRFIAKKLVRCVYNSNCRLYYIWFMVYIY